MCIRDSDLAHLALTDSQVQARLLDNISLTLREKGYRGLDVDFEYVYPDDAGAYAAFLATLARRLNPLGYPVIAALAPKTSSTQRGTLYEGHDYSAIGAAVNEVLLMTYEWRVLAHRLEPLENQDFEAISAYSTSRKFCQIF